MAKNDVFRALIATGSMEDLARFYTFNFFNSHYSLYNCGLILLQKPGATIVKSEAGWKASDREVKPQAIPIIILQPRGPVALVYDYSDTCGETAVELYSKENLEKLYVDRYAGTTDAKMLSRTIKKLTLSGIEYEERPYGDRLYGIASAHSYPNKLYAEKRTREGKRLIEIDSYFTISVNNSNGTHQKFLTILHELGHLYCGHISGGKRTEENRLPEYDRSHLDDDTKEYEAELVCKILCDRYCYLNLESEQYLAEHTINGKLPPFGLTEVIVAADRIADMLSLK